MGTNEKCRRSWELHNAIHDKKIPDEVVQRDKHRDHGQPYDHRVFAETSKFRYDHDGEKIHFNLWKTRTKYSRKDDICSI